MFFFSLQMLNVYFILNCHLFILHRNWFFRMFIFQWIRYSQSLYVFWLRKGSLIKYLHNCWRDGGVIQNACSCIQGKGKGVTSGVYVRTCTSLLEEIFVVKSLPQNISILREFNFADVAISKILWDLIFVDTDIARRKKISYLKRFVGMIMRQTYWS